MKLATLIYLEKNGKTLMINRNKKENDIHEGFYNGLGGKFEEGESPEDCAIREMKEETGLTIYRENLKLKGILTFPGFKGNDWRVFVFTTNDYFGELLPQEKVREGTLEWIDNNKLLDLKLNEGDYIFMPWLKEDKIFSAKFIYEEDKVKDYEVKFY